MMITITKKVEAMIEDINTEDSYILHLFEKLTSNLFKLVLLLGIPLILYMLITFI
ncbi:hypothetical protein [Bacillus dakarensis]|uniref:hypothetical protein n=1 Tax=Robertmurraya dakarensis TaxID=1926278 RepID=UPI0012B69321|nr:hypothetical protein [Bacillus dakarensis]